MLTSLNSFSQLTGPFVNPQLSPGVFYTNYDNLFMAGELVGKKIKLETIPKCKVEKISWDIDSKIPCFKISGIPTDAKQITITMIGGSGSQTINYGSVNIKVSNGKPK
jgi:hypothetical protein